MEWPGDFGAVGLELGDLCRRHRVGHLQGARVCRCRMIGSRHGPFGMSNAEPAGAQAAEGLWGRNLVDEMQVDRENGRRTLFLRDDVLVPDLLDDRAWIRA